MEDYKELLLGAGRARDKRVAPAGRHVKEWSNLTTLDINPACGCDLVCDLNAVPWIAWDNSPGGSPLAHELKSDYWDEIHAYEVLEHLGSQGDAVSFLGHFSELWRLLRNGGYLCCTVPSRFSGWLWGDPSHRRVITLESLVFLDQEQYAIQIDRPIAAAQPPTNMSDFRSWLNYRADFKLLDHHDNRTTFTFILQAVKPSRAAQPSRYHGVEQST